MDNYLPLCSTFITKVKKKKAPFTQETPPPH